MTTACYRLRFKVTAETPLHLGSGSRTGIVKHTLSYIPGSTVRGAVGSCLARMVCKKDVPLENHKDCDIAQECAYVDLFEDAGKSSKLFFRNSYPLDLSDGGTFLPTRRTLLVCKNVQCQRIYDSLDVSHVNCESCNHRLKPFVGFRCDKCEQRDSQSKPVANPVSISRVVRTAVDRRFDSVAQSVVGEDVVGTLHSADVVDAGSQFGLEIIVDRKAAVFLPTLRSVVRTAVPDEGIGGSKSRGLGKITFEELTGDCEVTTEMLEKRASEIETSHFAVRLLSPLVLAEGEVLNESKLLECCRRAFSWCFQEGKPSLPIVNLERQRLEYEHWSTWSLKDERVHRYVAVSAGSIFHFRCDERSKVLSLALAALECYAEGDFKPHGCGQVVIENPR